MCVIAVVRPDFGDRRDPSVLWTHHRGRGLAVNMKMRVRCAVQRPKPLSFDGFGLRQLHEREVRTF